MWTLGVTSHGLLSNKHPVLFRGKNQFFFSICLKVQKKKRKEKEKKTLGFTDDHWLLTLNQVLGCLPVGTLWQQIECAWGWQLESWELNEAQRTPSWTHSDLEKQWIMHVKVFQLSESLLGCGDNISSNLSVFGG